jgi:hypothetical protein
MIFAKERGRRYVEEQAHEGGDDRSAEAGGSWAGGRGCDTRTRGVEAHDLYLEGEVRSGMDVSQAQEAKQLRDENTRRTAFYAFVDWLPFDSTAQDSAMISKQPTLSR